MTGAPRPPTLENIDPARYPYPAADWRDESAYIGHDKTPAGAAAWAWEFTRRNAQYQFLTDVSRAARVADIEWGRYRDVDASGMHVLRPLPPGEVGVEPRVPLRIIEAMRNFEEWAPWVEARSAEGKGSVDVLERGTLTLVCVTASVLIARFSPYRWLSCWESPHPWTSAPQEENWFREPEGGTERRFEAENHRADTPPWPIEWPGDALGAEGDSLYDGYMWSEMPGCRVREPDENVSYGGTCEQARVLAGCAVGSLRDYGRRARFRKRRATEPKFRTGIAVVAFDLSAPIGPQLERLRPDLDRMKSRAEAAGLITGAKARELPFVRTGVDMLRYLDWSADDSVDKPGPTTFQRSHLSKLRASKEWSALKARAEQHRDDDPVRLARLR